MTYARLHRCYSYLGESRRSNGVFEINATSVLPRKHFHEIKRLANTPGNYSKYENDRARLEIVNPMDQGGSHVEQFFDWTLISEIAWYT